MTRTRKSALVSGYALALALLLLGGLGIIIYKVRVLGQSLDGLLPSTSYRVTLDMRLDGHGDDARVSTFVPLTDGRQTIGNEQNASPGLFLSTDHQGLNKGVSWTGSKVPDGSSVRYSFEVLSRPIRFELDSRFKVPPAYPPRISLLLRPEKAIQVDAPEIRRRLAELGANRGTVPERLKRIYRFSSGLSQRPFKGMTDALTALRLGEASCNGKSRLFAALARAAGIPARLVGGLILKPDQTRTSHQWVEAFIAGHWVPFDPTNGHFARLPSNYLTLYYGDETLFRHSGQINFRYRFEVEKALVPSAEARTVLGRFNVWAMFERLGLPFSLLRTLLMLPVGALVAVLFRNVVGLPTFGTFLPALIAAASRESGAAWGLLGLLLVVAAVTLLRSFFGRLQLLHSPSLAIVLTLVVATLLGITMTAERMRFLQLTRISLFPIAVLAITAERFYLELVERGAWDAGKQLGGTCLVILACYVVMNSLALQIIVIGFPEALLLVIAANLYLGRWVGMRLSEYLRFRGLLGSGTPGGEGSR